MFDRPVKNFSPGAGAGGGRELDFQLTEFGGGTVTSIRRWQTAVLSLLMSCLVEGVVAQVEVPAPASRAPVASTDKFVFYSDFRMNVHDQLRQYAVAGDTALSACVTGLAEPEREAWQRGVRFYDETFTGRAGRRRLLTARFHLVGFGGAVEDELGPMPDGVEQSLDDAQIAYRNCWWEEDDAANRRWIAAVVGMLDEVGEETASRLSQIYQTAWGAWPIPVDVAQYINFGGGNTVTDPNHIFVTSVGSGYQGRGALEMIFHEASHTIIGSRAGEPSRQLRLAAERLGVEVPGVLSHVVLFYTVGEVVRRMIEEKYGEEYLPYVYGGGLFDRAWPDFRQPMEAWWQPYLDGRVSMPEAAEGLLLALQQ